MDIVKTLPTVISIHAPTRGATFTQMMQAANMMNFNPRSHEGSDADHLTYMS